MKKLFLLIVFCLLLINSTNSIFAQNENSTEETPSSAPTYKINDLEVYDNPDLLFDMYKNPKTRIDGNTRLVWVTFSNLEPGRLYYTESSELKADSDGNIVIKVCGDGKDKLKGAQVAKYLDEKPSGGKIKEDCKKNRDYFHEGKTYNLTLYADKSLKSEILSAEFFVAHSYPLVRLNSRDIISQPIEITLWGRRPGGNSDNNYQVVVESLDDGYKKEHCYTIPEKDWWTKNLTVGINTQWWAESGNPKHPEHILEGTGYSETKRADELGASNTFGRGKDESNGSLKSGTYIAKINERISDNRPFGNFCEGGFTYMHIVFQILSKTKELKILRVVYDPNNSDRKDINNNPPLPCAKGEIDEENGTCKAFDVALFGKIPLDPTSFIKSLYSVILSIAAVAAIVIIIRAGYKFMYSRGDKELISQARSELTSAVIGLAFIIFAYVILSVIVVDILKIPGFN